jgi:hypothetical protein
MAKLIRPKVKTEREVSSDMFEPGSRTFEFRLRFNMVKGDHISSESQELRLMRTLNGQVVRLRAGSRGTQIKDSSEIAILGGPYSSLEEAKNDGDSCPASGFDLGGEREVGPRLW